MSRFSILISVAGLCLVKGAEDGLARKPPMGWRSWNYFGAEITQEKMELVAEALVQKRDSEGKPSRDGVSYKDLGYSDIGLDDNYQLCGKGIQGSFHDRNGNPLINLERFPNMTAMVKKIHNLGLAAGWYLNNCICRETKSILWGNDVHYTGDARALLDFGFDSVKLDGCGAFLDLDKWYTSLQRIGHGKQILIENCHWGLTVPNETWCPFHMFRTSGDIRADWGSMFSNLQTTHHFQGNKPLSRPGCWAYPDMLEVGQLKTNDEDRAHFGAWVITSSPLILGHNLLSNSVIQKSWKILSNREAIGINQDWAGHPGGLVQQSIGAGGKMIQVWKKPLSDGEIGVLFLNDNPSYPSNKEDSISVSLDILGAERDRNYSCLDVWDGHFKDELLQQGIKLTVSIRGHDGRLFKLIPKASMLKLEQQFL